MELKINHKGDNMANTEFSVNGIDVRYKIINKDDYISLTDLARYVNPDEPKIPIQTWMRNKDVVSYLGLWEQLNNPHFKGHEFTTFENKSGANSFYLSPEKWVTEFQRLKSQEQKALEWSAKRELAKVNYRIHTDAIKENIVPTLTEEQLKYVYADEADLLNVALFGKTAAQWRRENPTLKGNIRDYATIEQLLVIANMESYNAILIEQNVSQSDRLKQLNAMAISQLRVLQQSNSRLLSEGRKD